MGDLNRCYQILGLKSGASMEEISKAYKALVVIWHPDRIPKESIDLLARAEQKLKEINQARDTLRESARNQTTATATADPNPAANSARSSQPQEKARRYHPYAAYRAHYESRHGAAESESTRQAPPPPGKVPNYDYARSADPAARRPTDRTPPPSETAAPSTEPKPPVQDYYAQSRYNPAYDPAKQAPKPEPAPPPRPPQDYYRPQAMGYSPPRNQYQAPGTPQQPDLSGSDMAGQNLREKDLSNRNLSRANLRSADLSDAFLHRINLAGANLEGANLFRANLLEANLTGANMRNVNLIGADLSGCDLSGADLTGASVGFDDRVMVKMTGARLTGAIMPNGKVYGG